MFHVRLCFAVVATALATCALVGCGGGGSGDPDVDTGAPGGGGESTSVNPGLTGAFYLRPAASNVVYKVDAATGAKVQVAQAPSGQHSLYMSPDGSRYAVAINDSVTGQENSEFMVLEVYETAGAKRLMRLEFDGYANTFSFSPDGRYLAAVVYPDLLAANTLSASGLAILDLADAGHPQTTVNFTRTGTGRVFDYDWLPDNRYVYLRGDRTLISGPAAGGPESVLGTLTVPADKFVSRAITASPDGKQILLTFNWKAEALTHYDLWIANIDGSDAQRFSTGNYGEAAAWSPDGKFIALRTNAGAFSQSGSSTAYCERWYAPSTARGVDETSAAARPVRYVDNGKVVELPCFSDAAYQR